MRSRRTSAILVAVSSLALAVPASAAPTDIDNARFYANQTPYGDGSTARTAAPPDGYETFFVETVSRHGSRSMTSTRTEKKVLALWSKASARGQLTTRGRRFAADLKAFQKAEKSVGYGHLSSIGKAEWRSIGRRTATTYADFFTEVSRAGDLVAMTNSPVYRTRQSAHQMRSGLDSQVAGLRYAPRVTDEDLVISNGTSKKGAAAVRAVERRSSVRQAASHVLGRLYRPAFVRTIDDPVEAALDVYMLYGIAAGMADDTKVTFADYVPLSAARTLAEARDAWNFYAYGPGVAGERSSYKGARPILDDFFADLDRRIAGGSTAAVFRHAHGEATMPFAALSKVVGSSTQASRTFGYGSNPWRGWVAGRMAGSIEWTAFRNADGGVLVTVRQNEHPVRLDASCTPSAVGGGMFYRVSQLKKCLR